MKKSGKISLLVYVDWLETLELLEPAERGLVFSNLLRQTRQEELLPLSPMGEVVFSTLMRQVHWDLEKWKQVSAQRSAAGRKGGLASVKSRRGKQKEAKEAEQDQDQEQEQVQDQVAPSREPGWDALRAFYCQTIEAAPSERVLRELEHYRRELGEQRCREAIEIGGEHGAVSWNYVRSVLENMKKRGDSRHRKSREPRVGKRFIRPGDELPELEKQAIAMALAGLSEEERRGGGAAL